VKIKRNRILNFITAMQVRVEKYFCLSSASHDFRHKDLHSVDVVERC